MTNVKSAAFNISRFCTITFFAVSIDALAFDYDDCLDRTEKLVRVTRGAEPSHGDSVQEIRSALSEIEDALSKAKRACETPATSLCNTISRIARENGTQAAQTLCKAATDSSSFNLCMRCASTPN